MIYEEFIKSKTVIASNDGIQTEFLKYTEKLYPHQKDIIDFCLKGGRRAIFASFGLGKTFIQLEIAKQLIDKDQKPFLIVCPLGVSGEFKRDNRKLGTGLDITYITDTDKFEDISLIKNQIYLTNYERIRNGDINPDYFCGVSFDEASILRNLGTETTNYVLTHFKKIPYRFVATATPTPNDYIEILNYADFLGVIDRGQALTRFFQRDSQKAGNLKLYEHKANEFWLWVSSWAAFVDTPADLGYDATDYVLPKLNIIEHRINYDLKDTPKDRFGNLMIFKDLSKSLVDVSREKRDSALYRVSKALEIIDTLPENAIIWHHLEYERDLLESSLKGKDYKSVFGSQDTKTKEQRLIDFSENKYKLLLTKPKIAGSGCNFQNCHDMIFLGIDYKFNDFIQSIHRCYRYGQKKDVNVHIIYTFNEDSILKVLYSKWDNHVKLVYKMIQLIKNNGLNHNLILTQLERNMFKDSKKLILDKVTMYNDDCVKALDNIKDNSVHLVLTSIPFGDHYEYSENYNDFGHNYGNEAFFNQMDFLTPKLLRVLEPGRIACIHVKDRIRYSYQNGTSFTTISDFSGQTVSHFIKHGFYLMGKITVTTDVVAENNQTYRLGWTEQTKDATKMGVGLPEYVLIFRKAPTQMQDAYSDNPVSKSKSDYTKAQWQLDAHAYYRSDGNRLLSDEELKTYSLKSIVAKWKDHIKNEIYSYKEHLEICEALDELDKLSSTFSTLPVHSVNDMVWTDINRMNTLNTNQANKKKQKHICPLQFDIIERLINRYSMENEVVLDPFAGLFSTCYKALEMNRKSIGIELNSEYFKDGLYYIKSLIQKLNVPKLFDVLNDESEAA